MRTRYDIDFTEHRHRAVACGWDGPHRHQVCAECGHLLCATSRSTREDVQTRDMTGAIVGVRSTLRQAQVVIGEGTQVRTLRVTTARCGHKTVTVVEATPWK